MFEKDNSSEDIREVVQEVLIDVINSLSETAEDITKTTADNDKDTKDKTLEPKDIETSNKASGVEDKTEDMVACTVDPCSCTGEDTCPISDTSTKVTAIPKVEIKGNLGDATVIPKVNDLPPTTDIYQTASNVEGKVNTEITSSREGIPAADPVIITPATQSEPCVQPVCVTTTPELDIDIKTEPVPVDPDSCYTEDKTVIVSDTKDDTTPDSEVNEPEDNIVRVFGTDIVVLPNADGTYSVTFNKNGVTRVSTFGSDDCLEIIAELEDFLVEVMSGTDTAETKVPENSESEPTDKLSTDIDPEALLSSIRTKYGKAIYDIFELGLMTKHAILSESKDKFFAKDLKEYKAKGVMLAKELSDKKKVLTGLTKEYLKARKEKEQINKVVNLVSSSIRLSKKAYNDGLLTEDNADKICSTFRTLISSVVKCYESKAGIKRVDEIISNISKARAVISSTISSNKKKALVAKSLAEKSAVRSVVREARRDIDRLPRSSGIVHRRPDFVTPGVLVESSYVGNPRKTISGSSRNDGMDEMIGEIAALIK